MDNVQNSDSYILLWVLYWYAGMLTFYQAVPTQT
jgi:hypothetical protein